MTYYSLIEYCRACDGNTRDLDISLVRNEPSNHYFNHYHDSCIEISSIYSENGQFPDKIISLI